MNIYILPIYIYILIILLISYDIIGSYTVGPGTQWARERGGGGNTVGPGMRRGREHGGVTGTQRRRLLCVSLPCIHVMYRETHTCYNVCIALGLPID